MDTEVAADAPDPPVDTGGVEKRSWADVAREKRTKIAEEDKEAFIVYLTGINQVLTKLNPLKLKDSLTTKAGGQVQKVFMAGASLKIYCKSAEQKRRLLATEKLGDVEVKGSEQAAGFRASSRPSIVQHDRRVITGVSADITDEEVTQETGCVKAIRLQKMDKGQKSPSLSYLLLFARDAAPDFVRLGYTQYSTRAYIPVPTRCAKCQRFNHTAKACRGKVTCPRCAGAHKFEDCAEGAQRKCVNCHEAHSAAFKGCVKYKAATVVVRLAESAGITKAEAAKRQRAIVVQAPKPTPAVRKVCVETQTLTREMSTQTEESSFNTEIKTSKKREASEHDPRGKDKKNAPEETGSGSESEEAEAQSEASEADEEEEEMSAAAQGGYVWQNDNTLTVAQRCQFLREEMKAKAEAQKIAAACKNRRGKH